VGRKITRAVLQIAVEPGLHAARGLLIQLAVEIGDQLGTLHIVEGD